MEQIPFIGTNQNVLDAATFVKTVDSDLNKAINTLGNWTPTDAQADDEIKMAIFNNLPAGLVAKTNYANPLDFHQILVTHTGTDLNNFGVNVEMHLHQDLLQVKQSLQFGFALPVLPISLHTNGTINLSIGYDLELAFSFTVTNGTGSLVIDTSKKLAMPADQDPLQKLNPNVKAAGHEFVLEAQATLSNNANIQIHVGFFDGQASDAGTMQNPTQLVAGFAIDDLQDPLSSAEVFGQADAYLMLSLFVADSKDNPIPDIPSLGTMFELHWSIDQKSGQKNDAIHSPTIKFDGLSLKAADFFNGIIGEIVTDIQTWTKPLQPLIDALNAPLPVLSDLAGQDVSLETLISLVNQGHVLPPDIQAIETVVQTVLDLAKAVNQIQVSGNDLQINLGDFQFGQNDDLVDLAPGQMVYDLADYSNGNIPSLDTPLTTFAFSQGDFPSLDKILQNLTTQLDKYGPVGQAAERFLPSSGGNSASLALNFPFFDDPANGIVKLLLGQDPTLVQFIAKANFTLNAVPAPFNALNITAIPGLFAQFNAQVKVDAYFETDYDTKGIREFLHDFNAKDILDGFVMPTWDQQPQSPGNHLSITGGIMASAGINFPVFSAEVDGGITANLNFYLQDPKNPNSISQFRFLKDLSQLPGIFHFTGDIDGYLKAALKIGVNVPVTGFVGYEQGFNIASGTIISFGSDQATNPFVPPANVQLAQGQPVQNMSDGFNVGLNGVLVLNVGQMVSLRNYGSTDPNQDEVYTITHDNSPPQPSDPMTGEAVFVAFGSIKQRYAGVTSIQIDSGNGNDVWTIGAGVQADAFITAGNGNVHVTYLGKGNAHVVAGNGNDVLTGGHGYNYFRSGSGNSTLTGGDGKTALGVPPWPGQAQDVNGTYYISDLETSGSGSNILQGGVARNHLVAHGPGQNQVIAGEQDDYLEGDGGTNVFIAGRGHDMVSIFGGGTPPPLGTPNVVHWQDGDGDLTVSTADLLSHNALEVVGDQRTDDFALSPYKATSVMVQANANLITWQGSLEKVSMDGGDGADTITVNDLETTPVQTVGVNDGEASNPDGSADVVNVQGSPNSHNILVKTEAAFFKQSVGSPGPMGGIMFVQTHPNYQVHVAITNHEDTLNVFAKGSNNTINVQSNTGHTVLYADAGNDTFNVSSDAPANTGVLLEPPPPQQPPRPPFGLFGTLDVHAGPGKDALTVSESSSTEADRVILTDGQISGGPLHSFDPVTMLPVSLAYHINYDTPANGSFAGGIIVKTGMAADIVWVQSTPDGVPITIHSGGGDHINIGDFNQTLDSIGGDVLVDGGDSKAVVAFDDRKAGGPEHYLIGFSQLVGNFLTRGNKDFVYRNVGTMILNAGGQGNTIDVNAIGDAATLINAGAGNDLITVGDVANTLVLDRPLTVNGQSGMNQLVLNDGGPQPSPVTYEVSEGAVAGSHFQPINYTNLAALTLHTAVSANGSNHVLVLGTHAQTATTLDLSTAPHDIAISDASNTLDHLRGPLTIHGQLGAQEALKVIDTGAASAEVYLLDAGGLSRSGAALISYDHLGTVVLSAAQSNPNMIDVRGTDAGLLLTTVDLGNAGDVIRVGDANHSLNGIHSPVSVQGGSGPDTLKILDDGFNGARNYSLSTMLVTAGGPIAVSFSGIDTLEIHGAEGKDLFQVTSLPASNHVNLDGGTGDNQLVGPNQPNVWKITSPNGGTLDTAVSFTGVQNLTGGSQTNDFQIQTGGHLTGALHGGGTSTLDYSAFANNVVVDLQTGTATEIAGGVSGIQNVTGGNGGSPGTFNLLIGAGNGILRGSTGRRNILVAGTSHAVLYGGDQEDLLIAGSTNYDTEAGLLSWLKIAAYWSGPTSYATRVTNLLAGNGVPKLDASTVHGNGGGNTLIGKSELALIFSDGKDFIFGFDPKSETITVGP
ncbi:MAG TPA: calcium-binding protein [Gemmataceae bacterium]|nr:calcium-binding protein [Gemmataceae bacterium]